MKRVNDAPVCLSPHVEHHLVVMALINALIKETQSEPQVPVCYCLSPIINQPADWQVGHHKPHPARLTSFSLMSSWSPFRTTNWFFQISLKIPFPQNFRIQPTLSGWAFCGAQSCGPWNKNQVKDKLKPTVTACAFSHFNSFLFSVLIRTWFGVSLLGEWLPCSKCTWL